VSWLTDPENRELLILIGGHRRIGKPELTQTRMKDDLGVKYKLLAMHQAWTSRDRIEGSLIPGKAAQVVEVSDLFL